MKRLLSLTTVLVMTVSLFSFVGCGSKATTSNDKPADKATAEQSKSGSEKKYKIATVVKDSSNPWFIRMEQGVKKFASEEKGTESFQKGPAKCDAAQQVQVIEDMISQGVDAICVVPISPEACEPVLKKAMDKGIVVITHEASNQQNTLFDIEAFDNGAYGAFIMDNLAKAMNYEGKYATMVAYLTSKSHNEWADGAVARQKEKYPKMTLIPDRIESEDNQETAYERSKELLKKYPDIKGIMGTSSNDAPGAAKAINEMGKKGQVFTAGTSVVSVAGKFLEDGSLDKITFWDPADAGYAMNAVAKMVLEGKKDQIKDGVNLGIKGYENMKLKGKVLIGAGWVAVDKSNMKDYDF